MARCSRPPAGWHCNLDEGHEGPCPTWPNDVRRGPYDAQNRDPFYDQPPTKRTWAGTARSLVFWAAVVAIIWIVRTT